MSGEPASHQERWLAADDDNDDNDDGRPRVVVEDEDYFGGELKKDERPVDGGLLRVHDERAMMMAAPVPQRTASPLAIARKKPHSFIKTLKKIEDVYELGVMLGAGISGVVKLATLRADRSQQFACKIIPSRSCQSEEAFNKFADEISILSTLHHPNILNLKDVFVDLKNVYIVTDLCSGGELFDRILDRGHLTERGARSIVKKLFEAVSYLHSHGIVHRDLKPENIMFVDQSEKAEPKIVDFGFATKLLTQRHPHMRANSQVGTLGYVAPEVMSGKPYSEKCDVWSLGIITYILLSGVPPFCELPDDDDEDSDESPSRVSETPFWVYVNRMRTGPNKPKLTFPTRYWKHVSRRAQHFVQSVLEVDPLRRPRSVDVLKDPWLKTSSHDHAGTVNLSNTLQAMKWFTNSLRHGDVERFREAAKAASGRLDDEEVHSDTEESLSLPRPVPNFRSRSAEPSPAAGAVHSPSSPPQMELNLKQMLLDKRVGRVSPRAKGIVRITPTSKQKKAAARTRQSRAKTSSDADKRAQ